VARKNPDLHGSVPDSSRTALLVIDVINDFTFPGGGRLLKRCLGPARRIAALKERLSRRKVPVIYANDNFGKWKSDFRALIDHSMDAKSPGSAIAKLLVPSESDYFVLKPKHSAFFSTTLETLLLYLGAHRLILTGFTTNQCILFTANDAFLRDYHLWVPRDCVAAMTDEDHRYGLFHLSKTLSTDIRPSTARRRA
jgi:nicotinamidase-related amidase